MALQSQDVEGRKVEVSPVERHAKIATVKEFALARLELATIQLGLADPEFIGSRTAANAEFAALRTHLDRVRADWGDESTLPDQAWLAEAIGTQDEDILWLTALVTLDPLAGKTIARIQADTTQNVLTTAVLGQVFGADYDEHIEVHYRIIHGLLQDIGLIDVVPEAGQHRVVMARDVAAALMGERRLSYAAKSCRAETVVLEAPDTDEPPMEPVGVLLAQAQWETPLVMVRIGLGVHALDRMAEIAAYATHSLLVADASLIDVNDPATIWELVRESALHHEVLVIENGDTINEFQAPHLVRGLLNGLRRWQGARVVVLVSENCELSPTLDRASALKTRWLREPGVVSYPGMTPEEIVFAEETRSWDAEDIEKARLLWGAHLDAGYTRSAGLRIALNATRRGEMGRLARMTRPDVTLNHLVLQDDVLSQVKEVLAAVRNRRKVLQTWGFSNRIRRGLGVCCLFDGDPGTGKTLSAEVIAGELGLRLMRVDVSNIVDKYIGETEKHLTQIFAKADPDTSLLLFDEADSLFSKRTEVKSSNDHYSNMSTNVLLQLIEAYNGVVVLTTNLKKSIDAAFERRIMFRVNFPIPGEAEREALWRLMLPPEAEFLEEIDFVALCEVEMAGGNIKNAALRAAYDAARQGRGISTDDLLEAAYKEVASSGKLVRRFE